MANILLHKIERYKAVKYNGASQPRLVKNRVKANFIPWGFDGRFSSPEGGTPHVLPCGILPLVLGDTPASSTRNSLVKKY
jgi:hypothetical protein